MHETHNAPRSQTTPLPGKRPAPLSEVTGPQVAVTSGTWLPVCPSWVRHRWPIPRPRPSMAAPSPSSYSAPWKSRGRRRRRRLWRRRSWSSWRRSLLRRRSGCLRCSGGTGKRGPGSLLRPGPPSPASNSSLFTGSWPRRRLGRRGKRGRRRRGGGCGRLAGLCSAALRDVSYDSLLVGFYGPLYLAVTCPMLFLPEVYCTWFTLGDQFWRDSVFCAFGLTVDTCYCQSTEAFSNFLFSTWFTRILRSILVLLSACSVFAAKSTGNWIAAVLVSTTAVVCSGWFCWYRRTSRYISFFSSQAQMLGIMAGRTRGTVMRRDVSLLLSTTGAWFLQCW